MVVEAGVQAGWIPASAGMTVSGLGHHETI
jgi:hypothetical protein